MFSWINRNKESIIRMAFLVPILSVAIISISHVVEWYDLANPISWAIYLSIAIEIAALSSIAAASVKVKGFSVWLVFIIVTLIQFIGNIYFSYTEIDVLSKNFKDWAELTGPLFESFSDIEDTVAQRRLLAILEGGLLPLISLTCLHFFIKYGDRDLPQADNIVPSDKKDESAVIYAMPNSDEVYRVQEKAKRFSPDTTIIKPEDEPTDLANSQLSDSDSPKPIQSDLTNYVIFTEPVVEKEEPIVEQEQPIVELEEEPVIEQDENINEPIIQEEVQQPIEVKRKEVGPGISLTKKSNTYDNNLYR